MRGGTRPAPPLLWRWRSSTTRASWRASLPSVRHAAATCMPGPLLAALPGRVRACGCPLLPRLYAPRCACLQHVEFMLELLPTKTTKAKPWRLSVRREELCSDVIGCFGFHEGQCRGFPKQKLFQRTSIVFIDANGDEEEGNDLGGLTVEMYSSFFREVLLCDLGLFEGIAGSAGGGSSIGLLPKPDAPVAALEAVGRVICKCAACAGLASLLEAFRGSCRHTPQPVVRLCAGACLTTSRLAAGSAASSSSTWRTRTNGTSIPCCSHLARLTPLHTHAYSYTFTGASSARRTRRSRHSPTSTPSLRSGGPSCSPSRRRG